MKIIIDANSILFRYIFAIKEDMMDSDGNLVSGLYGFCKTILKIITDFKSPTFVVFDRCTKNFRKQICNQYKANRPKLDKNVFFQSDRAIEFCKLSNIPYSWSDTYEADDIIATFIYENPQEEFIIVSNDKDLLQLISKNVKVWNPFSKITIDEQYVFNKYNVYPHQFALFLSLCGDNSDNVKGVRGIGPKTAAKILVNINSIENLVEKYGDTVAKSHSLVILNKQATYLPMIWDKINFFELRRFLSNMNFHSLLNLT